MIAECGIPKMFLFGTGPRSDAGVGWKTKRTFNNTHTLPITNMSVYFGHPVPDTSTGKKPRVAPALESRGIRLLRAAPCDVNIYGIPIANTTTWGVFISVFQTLLFALFKRERQSLCPDDCEITGTHPDPLPFRLPPLCVSLRQPSQSGLDHLLSSGFEQVEIRGKTYFLASDISRDTIKQLLAEDCPAKVDEKCFSPLRFVNLSAMYTVLDLISWISYASQAMTFCLSEAATDSQASFDDGNHDDSERSAISSTTGTDGSKTFSLGSDYHRIGNLFRGGPPITLLDKYPKGEVSPSYLLNRACYFFPTSFTTPYPGHILRYCAELADGDKTTVTTFLQRFMFRNIGDSDDESIAVLAQVSSAWGLIRDTDFGLELTHLVKSIMLAFESGTSFFPLFDAGYYEGSVLAGGGQYSIALNDKSISPFDNPELVKQVKALATHAYTLQSIEDIARREAGDLAGGLTSYENMVGLRARLLGLPLTESTKNTIIGLAASLRFPSRPWNVNLNSIKQMIEISRDVSLISDSTPIGPRALFSTDPIIVALSCFSESSCPSFLHPNGSPIDLAGNLPRPSGESSRGGRARGKQQTSNASWTFAVRRVRFDESVGDLRKILKERMARSVSSSVARATGCVVFSGKQFSEIFSLLAGLANVLDGSAALTRTIEDTRMGEGPESRSVPYSGGHRSKRVKL